MSYPPDEPNLAWKSSGWKYATTDSPVVDHSQFEYPETATSPLLLSVTLALYLLPQYDVTWEVMESAHWELGPHRLYRDRGITAIGKKM